MDKIRPMTVDSMLASKRLEGRLQTVQCDVFEACENYLNLEYYQGPLDGDLRQLAIASETMKGDLCPDEALNFNQFAELDNHLAASFFK